MIINGGSRAGGRNIARHLSRTDTNEVAQLVQITGTAANDLDGALREMEAVAAGTRCKYPLYHANIDPPPGATLTPEQWRRSVDLLGEKLGLGDQPRAVMRHIKNGREHVHVVWSRIDPDHMRAISDSNNYRIHEQVSRQLEREFGLERVEGVHTGDRDQARPVAEITQAEQQQAERTGRTVEDITTAIRAAWERSNTGGDFARELGEAGFVLARGDRRAFVILDEAGGIHSPRRRLGIRAAVINERCADLDPAALPSIEDGRQIFAFREASRAALGHGETPAQEIEREPQTPAPEKADRADPPPAAEKTAEPAPVRGGSDTPEIDRRDGPVGVSGKTPNTPASPTEDEPAEVESPGLLSLIFAKVTGLFDFVKEALFAAAFAPTADIKEQTHTAPPLAPEAPPVTPPEPEQQRPARRQYKLYEPRHVPPPPRDPSRERDDAGREREIERYSPPDDEPGGG